MPESSEIFGDASHPEGIESGLLQERAFEKRGRLNGKSQCQGCSSKNMKDEGLMSLRLMVVH